MVNAFIVLLFCRALKTKVLGLLMVVELVVGVCVGPTTAQLWYSVICSCCARTGAGVVLEKLYCYNAALRTMLFHYLIIAAACRHGCFVVAAIYR